MGRATSIAGVVMLGPACSLDPVPQMCDDEGVTAWAQACRCPDEDNPIEPVDEPDDGLLGFDVMGPDGTRSVEIRESSGARVECRHVDCEDDRATIEFTDPDTDRRLEMTICRFDVARSVTVPAMDPAVGPCPEDPGVVLSWSEGDITWTSDHETPGCQVIVAVDVNEMTAVFECDALRAEGHATVAIARGTLACGLQW